MRIVVAMSGGVDSSVAAALLAEQGHEVVGVSMQLYPQGEGGAAAARDYGARGVYLGTMSIQAPGFYPRMGYRECGRMEDYPVAGQTFHHFMKAL